MDIKFKFPVWYIPTLNQHILKFKLTE